MNRTITAAGLVAALALGCSSAWGQLPGTRLDAVFPPGAQAGQTVEVVLVGADLDDVDRLVFSHPGITAARKMADPGPFDSGPQPVEGRFVVTVKSNVPPGQHSARCQGKYGLSNPRAFVVDTLAEVIEQEPNNQRSEAKEIAVPSVANGQLNGAADVDWFRFQAKSGQRLLIDGHARRIDSRSDLVVTVAASDGRILAESRQGHAGDPLIDLQIPANGEYYLKVQDALYQGGLDFVYRIVLSARPHIAFVFPPAGAAGANAPFTVYGRNLPGGKVSTIQLNGKPLQQLQVKIPIPGNIVDRLAFSSRLDPHQAGLDALEYRVQSPTGPSNPALVTVATAEVVREQSNNDTPDTAQQRKHVKSNAIVFAKSDRTLGVGAGQMARVDSCRLAVWKAEQAGLSLDGSVVASDAMFPFPDGLLAGLDAGASAAIQPGGSIRDEEVIAAANEREAAMIFTGHRHFLH